jgi:2-iminobutanoate/2-iminopropanoate deaminase
MMGKRKPINVPGLSHGDAPIPIAIMFGTHLYSSAVFGTDRETGELADLESQTAHAFSNMKCIVETAGGNVQDIAAVRVFLIDYGLRQQVNIEWLKMFPDSTDRPTRHAIQMPMFGGMVVQLEFDAEIENPII